MPQGPHNTVWEAISTENHLIDADTENRKQAVQGKRQNKVRLDKRKQLNVQQNKPLSPLTTLGSVNEVSLFYQCQASQGV